MAQQAATARELATSPGAPVWSEDWLAVVAGFAIFLLALGPLAGLDLLGWATGPRTWVEIGQAVRPASTAYAAVGAPAYAAVGAAALIAATYLFVLILMSIGATLMGASIGRFVLGFTVVYWLAYLAWVIGSYAAIAATTPAEMARLGIGWSLRLTG